MGVEESSIPVGSAKLNSQNIGVPISGQITIAIHGKRKVGKSSLIKKMRNTTLTLQYTPTPTMESTEFFWNPVRHPDETIKIIVWEVVDIALKKDSNNPNIVLPDARTVDTFSTTDGIIILYDPDDEVSVEYTVSLISKASYELPILVLANFLDRRKMVKKVPEELEPYLNRIVHVQTSILSNRGLSVIAEWLDRPLLYNEEKSLMKRIEDCARDIDELENLFALKVERANSEICQAGIEDDNEDFDQDSDELPLELTDNLIQNLVNQTKTKGSYVCNVQNKTKQRIDFSSRPDNDDDASENESDGFMVRLDYNV